MIPQIINIENSCCKKPNSRGRKYYVYINRMRVQKIRPDHAQPTKEQKDKQNALKKKMNNEKKFKNQKFNYKQKGAKMDP